MRFAIGGALVALMLGGCAARGTAAPEIRDASQALETANGTDARSLVASSLYMELADRELVEARDLAAAGDLAGARGTALRAKADAMVAATIARQIAARDAARRTMDEASALEERLGQQGPLREAAR